MSNSKVILYSDAKFASPYALSAFVALQEKGIPFELKKINLQEQENTLGPFREISLTKRVPTLVHGDFQLAESSAIAEYLEDVFPAPQYPALYPKSIQHKAQARQMQAWIRSDFMPIRQERSTYDIFFGRPVKPLSDSAKTYVERLFSALEQKLKGDQQNLFGAWCIADTDLAMMLQRLVLGGDPMPDNIARYANAQWQRESVQAWVKQIPR